MKVLVVDDSKYITAVIQEVLEGEGMEVMSAENGVDGYAAYLRFKPDLIITDIDMPQKNGLEMMEDIRVHDPRVKTVYMSGDLYAYWPSLQKEKERYGVGLFEKPFALTSLKELVS